VAFATARTIDDAVRKARAPRTISEHVMPGRWDDVRPPNGTGAESDFRAGVRDRGGIGEDSAGATAGRRGGFPTGAGILPLRLEAQSPIPDTRVADGIEPPGYVLNE